MTNSIDSLIAEIDNHKSVAGISIQLPSGGGWYGPRVLSPGSDPTELHVRPFTMQENINFQNPFLIMSGKAVYDMVRNTCSAVLSPSSLLAYDVDAISIAARNASYGSVLELSVECENQALKEDGTKACGETSLLKTDLYRIQMQYVPLDYELWQVDVPNGQRVRLRPPTYAFMIDQVKKQVETRRSVVAANGDVSLLEKIIESGSDNSMEFAAEAVYSITSADGSETSTDRSLIKHWLSRVPSTWSQTIVSAHNRLMEPLQKAGTLDVNCPHCGHAQTINVTGDPVSFFTQASPKSSL